VVDDDRFYQEFCSALLREDNYEVDTTFTGQEALALIAAKEFDLMLLDLVMPGMEGEEILEKAKQLRPEMDVVIMTGYATVESAIRTLKAGASDYLVKPLNQEELKIAVKRTIEFRHLLDEHQEMKTLLTLYESIQRVSSCLERERLYRLGLDALMASLNGSAGLSLFLDQADELKYWVGLELEEAQQLAEGLRKNFLSPLPKKFIIAQDPEFLRPGGPLEHLKIRSLVIFPFTVLDRLDGAMVIFSQGLLEENILTGNVKFVHEQVRRSFENAIKYQDAQRLIFIDDLSGLFNTRYLDLALQNELARARRFKKHLSLLFIDLDYFKHVNDQHGHLVGSWVLVETSRVLKFCLRDIDVLVRYGGDEFIVILAETDRPGASIVAERIREKIAEHEFRPRENISLKLTCCVGIAAFPEDANNKESLIHLADKAMYRGKETTRNMVYTANNL
jgi:diguanylate cyclase (GGDEF)-like protein